MDRNWARYIIMYRSRYCQGQIYIYIYIYIYREREREREMEKGRKGKRDGKNKLESLKDREMDK